MKSQSLQTRTARTERIVARLRARGHRLTPQRLAIVRALVESGEHPSAEQLYRHVQPEYPMMSPATVYKTLDTLKAVGEVLELEFRNRPNRYDATMPTPHPHAVCTRCGRIDDVGASHVQIATDEAAAATGYRLFSYRLDFYGLCPGCAEA